MKTAACGVFYDHVDLHQSNISASHISYCRQGGVVVRGGNVRNIHIAGCDIEANMAKDGPPAANVLLDCADGSVAEVAITGCTIQHSKEAAGSANIRILGRGFMDRRGERLPFNCGNVTIGDNVLSDVQTNIHLDGVRGVTITGNTFWQGYEHNLLVEDSSHVVVGPNMLEQSAVWLYERRQRQRRVPRLPRLRSWPAPAQCHRQRSRADDRKMPADEYHRLHDSWSNNAGLLIRTRRRSNTPIASSAMSEKAVKASASA